MRELLPVLLIVCLHTLSVFAADILPVTWTLVELGYRLLFIAGSDMGSDVGQRWIFFFLSMSQQ